MRTSKTFEISRDNSNIDETGCSQKNLRDTTFTEAILVTDEDKDNSLLFQESLGLFLNSPTKKEFRIKNATKPFNSLNTALMTFSQTKPAINEEKNQESLLKVNGNSPKNFQIQFVKKKSKFGAEGEILNSTTLNPKELEKKETRKLSNLTPKSDSQKKANDVPPEKPAKSKKLVVISPKNNPNNNSMSLNTSNNKDKPFSMQESKKLENIKLDKETLRDLNRYTDKNFLKSIKASLRKLEIIEKISEDNFRDTDKFPLTFCSNSPPKKRNSTNDQRKNSTYYTPDNKANKFLPIISPDNSPKKSFFTKNARIPKN